MVVIKVPTPPQNAADPNRPISSLLKAQVEHLYAAEKRLPSRYRSEIYVNAIRTEGEAANYIREVTEAIHNAHEDARRRRFAIKREAAIEIAAATDTAARRRKHSGAGKSAKKRHKGRGLSKR